MVKVYTAQTGQRTEWPAQKASRAARELMTFKARPDEHARASALRPTTASEETRVLQPANQTQEKKSGVKYNGNLVEVDGRPVGYFDAEGHYHDYSDPNCGKGAL